MSKNTVVKLRDNAVVFKFEWLDASFAVLGLDNFSRVTVEIGPELYDTLIHADELVITDTTTLTLKIGMVTALADGSYTPTITGYNATDYVNGEELTGGCINKLSRKVVVC